jgi:hypothetical protein
METKKFRSKNHALIHRFLSLERAKGDKNFWPREMKLAGKLIKKYPFEFLSALREPFVTKIPSLAWFLTDEGEVFLSSQFFEYKKQTINLVKEKEEIVLQPTKIGEDRLIERTPKTLRDFLKYG